MQNSTFKVAEINDIDFYEDFDIVICDGIYFGNMEKLARNSRAYFIGFTSGVRKKTEGFFADSRCALNYGREEAKKEGYEVMGDNEGRINQNYNNHFYGKITGVQIQQGVNNSVQDQRINRDFDCNKVKELLEQIKRHDDMLDKEYGEKASEFRNRVEEIEGLLQEKGNQSKIKTLLLELKDLSKGITGSLIASGIFDVISQII